MNPVGTVFLPFHLNAQEKKREQKKRTRRYLEMKNNFADVILHIKHTNLSIVGLLKIKIPIP